MSKANVKVYKHDFIDAAIKMRSIVASNKGHIRETLAYQLFKAKFPNHPVNLSWQVRSKTNHGCPPTLSKYISYAHNLFEVNYVMVGKKKAKLLKAKN